MSEIKRVALNTLEPQKESDKVIKKSCKTVRISVILPESNEDNCPEYNYKDQLAAVKRKNKVNKETNPEQQNGVDPFGEDDDDVRRIALEMEAKYGTGVTTGKKKRKGRKDDYADIGMGYDESDSFIDNTDGYDEIIPQNVTTLHGGFYINCGALEFKTDDEASSQISSSSSDSEEEKEKPNNRKRILDTTDESDSDAAKNDSHVEKKPKLQSDKNAMQLAIKKKLFSQNKIQIKKRRPIDPLKRTVKELLREKREDLHMSIPPDLEKEEMIEKDSLKENKKPMSISSVTDAIESVVKQVVEEGYNPNSEPVDFNNQSESAANKCNLEPPLLTMESESSQDQTEKRELVKLPENIPTDILEIINKIKQAALDYRDEGKKKFFSDEVNSYLLNLERKCKILGKSSRLRVYDYLSYFCKVRKETLIRRARNLMLEEEERKQILAINKLKDCVASIMPRLLADYEQESQKVLAKKFSAEGQNEENKTLKLPRRRFPWTEETKKLLKDIMAAKKKCLLLEGKQKDNLEELMVTFMKHSLVPIWPEGWMLINNLKKAYNSMTDSSKVTNNSKYLSDKSSTSKSIIDTSNIDKSNIDPVKVDKSILDKSIVDKPIVDKPNVDKPNVDNINLETPIITTKHSNLTITPVEVKTTTAKPDMSNSVTVTKITNDVSTNSNKISESTTMSGPHLLKKMFFDEIAKPKPEESKSSLYSSHERSKPEKDYSRPKIINLDMPAPKSSSRHGQESYKQPSSERNLSTEQKNPWPNEMYGSHKEQSLPADYSSKQSRQNEEKVDFIKPNTTKSVWPNKDSEPVKYSRHSDGTQSSKHSKSNDNPKPFSLSVSDLLKPEKNSDGSKYHSESSKYHSETSKHHSDSSKHHQDSSKHHQDSSKHHQDSSKRHSDGSKRHSDNAKHHSDSSKHHSDSSKHHSDTSKHYSDGSKPHSDGSKHHSESSKYYSDSSKHYSDKTYYSDGSKHHNDISKYHTDSSKHSKSSDNLKLPADNNVIVLNAHQNKESDSSKHKDDLKSASNPLIPKSVHCQLMDLSDGRSKTKIDDSKSHSKYSSSSSKVDLGRLETKTSKSADLLLTNSASYFADPMKLAHKFPEFSTGSSFLSSTPNKLQKSDGDNDIQMVMENLKALQKLSCSPVKNDSTSSPVSVIAFNKNFHSSKSSSSNQGGVQRTSDANSNKTADFSGSFQDDFQKQFINSIQMSANPSTTKSNYRCS